MPRVKYINYNHYIRYGDTVAEKTIGVSETTHKRLESFCGKGRTYDEAINNLLDYYFTASRETLTVKQVQDLMDDVQREEEEQRERKSHGRK